jgi:hypothetical protein
MKLLTNAKTDFVKGNKFYKLIQTYDDNNGSAPPTSIYEYIGEYNNKTPNTEIIDQQLKNYSFTNYNHLFKKDDKEVTLTIIPNNIKNGNSAYYFLPKDQEYKEDTLNKLSP